MSKKREAEYKPLSFGTTMRNPERFKEFLPMLFKHNNKILTNDIINEIVHDLVKNGLYEPMYAKRNTLLKEKLNNNEILSDEETQDIIRNSPQHHKEAGFDRGWASRFDTWYRLVKEWGFVYYEIGKPIEFSEAGKKLVDSKDIPDNSIFLNALVKYKRNNPFRRILNNNAPLILLLKIIDKLNSDSDFNNIGISKKEIPILLCWRNDDADELYKTIKQLRKQYKYEPSDEAILDICDELTGGRHNSNKNKTILQEYPDDFIRKMKLTGLISLRGMGRFVDINHNEQFKIDYILNEYKNISYPLEERAYFDFVSTIDYKLINLSPHQQPNNASFESVKKWAEIYTWHIVKKELLSLVSSNTSSTDKILKYIPRPLRFEFLASLAIVNKYPDYIVKPNYIIDDEGLPSSHAPGNNPDIECLKIQDNSAVLIEVTLLNGTAQFKNEGFSIPRHLDEYKKTKRNNSFALFIAPQIFKDTQRYFKFILDDENLDVRAFDIKQFVDNCDKDNQLQNF